jgi:CheY-like chemotaxis protein
MPTVLCVDDDLDLLTIRGLLLESLGYRALTATNTRDALALLRCEDIDLAVLDYKLDEKDSLALLLHLRCRYPAVPVIMNSGHDGVPELARRLSDAFIEKAEPTYLLVGAIEVFAGRPPSSRPNRSAAAA